MRFYGVLLCMYGLLIGSVVYAQSDSLLNAKMDQWHKDAANANTSGYFGFMDANFVYLGTDIKENWTKESFLEFCKPYFAKGKGWDFKATKRNWFYNGNVAWFEEYLTTWMGPIRASGVLLLKNGNWYITHYNLTLTVDNDKIKSYLEINKVEK